MSQLNDILPRLKDVKRTGSGYMAICPSHHDTNRSLSIKEANGKLLLHCFGGCSFQSVLSALGVEKRASPPPLRLENEPERKGLTHLGSMWALYRSQTDPEKLSSFASLLGVSPMGLEEIGCCWTPYDAWGFPMMDAKGNFRGMRLRNEEGKKWSVSGGREGLFLGYRLEEPFCIVEGPTDLAALFSIGYAGLGRPSCQGSVDETAEYCRTHKINPIVIADGDGPGIEGAKILCKEIRGSKLAVLPAKDTREFLRNGGSSDMLMSCLKAAQ